MTELSEPRGDRVLVLGGYGAVGRPAARALGELLPGRVVVAGRDGEQAAAFAAGSDGRLLAARADLADRAALERALRGVRLVVLAVTPRSAREHPAPLLFERGTGLVDVTADRRVIGAVEQYDGVARAYGASAVLSVGVAPGLTNLLARRVHEEVGGAERIDLSVLLGAGEKHGREAVCRTVTEPAAERAAGARPLRVTVPPPHGTRTHHPFPLSDQFTLRRTLGTPAVTTRLSIGSGPLTALLFGLRRAGVFRAARLARLDGVLSAALARMAAGGEDFAVRADAHRQGRRAVRILTARSQARITGLVAAQVAARMYEGAVPPGVHHIEQLSTLADVPETLAPRGLTEWQVTPERDAVLGR
ncbi:saccharopine dehydrogenase NADP-binding domain-containing protein [Streptomyces sp. ODS28]|uniref:saccharopine dehydrogenase NADP-binding domain-containing protein n=1 Tax=Streptomyces sp. ODS28 TaxID=3136688 RepID=UPI0031EC4D33